MALFFARRTKMPSKTLPDRVVRLTTASNPVEAHLLEQALRDEGIKSHVVGDYLDAGVGDVPGLYPEVWVHEDDLARAQEILRRHQASHAEDAAEEPEA